MFRIGEFSKIAQVPASQLRYYNDIGLFVPMSIDNETGYRYYSVEQLAHLNRILALKDLGLSLEQIKRLLEDEVAPDEIRGMLTLRKAQIEQTLQAEAARLRVVESRLQSLEREGGFQDDDVVVKSLPAQPFLSLRQTYGGLDGALEAIAAMHQAVSQQVKEKVLGRFAAVVHSPLYEENEWDLEFGFVLNRSQSLTVALPNASVMSVQDLPAVTAVTAMRFGGPENGHLAYSAIGTWAEKHQYTLMGPGREVFVVPPQPGHESEMVVEIQFPVQVS